jgi:hypothetical protein
MNSKSMLAAPVLVSVCTALSVAMFSYTAGAQPELKVAPPPPGTGGINSGVILPAVVPDCSAGFTKGSVSGAAPAPYSYVCTTTVQCPPPATKQIIGGIGTPIVTMVSGGAKITYSCSYSPSPQ